MISKLTENVLNGADRKLLQQFAGLKPTGDRPATIEDLINFLVRYKGILGTITSGDGHSITVDEINSLLTAIKAGIV